MSGEMKETNVKYVKVCDRHGYCVMKIKPEEVTHPSQDIEERRDTKRKQSNLIQKKEQDTGKILFEKDTGRKNVQEQRLTYPISTQTRNPLLSKISNKKRGKMRGITYDEITLTTTDGEENCQ